MMECSSNNLSYMVGDAIRHTQRIPKITTANNSYAIPTPHHHSIEVCMNNPKGKKSEDGCFGMSWVVVYVVSVELLPAMLLWLPW